MHDRKQHDMQDYKQPSYSELTGTIFGSCVDYKRLHHPDYHAACDHAYHVLDYTVKHP
jgi:hypothetical protein